MVGAFVATRPDLSITVLVVVVGGGFAAAGIARLVSAAEERRPWLERSLGGGLLLGVVAVAWQGMTVQVLARLIGIGLLLSGAGHLVAAIRGRTEERLASAMGGLARVGFGMVVLGWPRLTLFLTGIVFGAWLVFFGLSQAIAAILAWRRPQPAPADQPTPGAGGAGCGRSVPAPRWWWRSGCWLAASGCAPARRRSCPTPSPPRRPTCRPRRGSCCAAGRSPPGAPGRPGLADPVHHHDGRRCPAVASGTVLAPAKRPAGPLPVLSVAHGWVG